MTNEYHTPVLVGAVLQYLQAERGGIFVDGTLGGGGHTESILSAGPAGTTVVGFDVDEEALAFARRRLRSFGERVTYVHDDFSNMKNQLELLEIDAVDGILLDVGVSSHQLDAAERGFSFQREERLDMRMNREQLLHAGTVVNTYDAEKLADVLYSYGEERNARRIARRIVEARTQHPVETTGELARIVRSAAGGGEPQKSLARVFQAIRIEVNKELEHLRRGLAEALSSLKTGGRLVVISYHSLEDRLVKEFFVRESSTRIRASSKLLPDIPRQPRLAVLTKKPLTPDDREISGNPRARSAKLRAAEKKAA